MSDTWDLSRWDFEPGTTLGEVHTSGEWLLLPLVLLRDEEIVVFNNTAEIFKVAGGIGGSGRFTGLLDPGTFESIGTPPDSRHLDVSFTRNTTQPQFYAPYQSCPRGLADAPSVNLRFALQPLHDAVQVPGSPPARLLLPKASEPSGPQLPPLTVRQGVFGPASRQGLHLTLARPGRKTS